MLALTLGDVAGIGPELIALSLAALPADQPTAAVVVGQAAVLERAAGWCGVQGLDFCDVRADWAEAERLAAAAAPSGRRCVPVWSPPGLPPDLASVPLGQVDRRAGVAAAACIREAVRLAQAGKVAGIVTAPLHKEALALAGEPYPGHTELLQAEGAPLGQPPAPVRMMLANEQLKTVLVTIHVSLRQAIEQVTTASVLETLRITHDAARLWGLPCPRIAVAGLNPHAGEGGLFGSEDRDVIAPAVAQARALGIDATGPWAPDTVFMRARHAPPAKVGEFDVVVAMYHDQGLIPVKYMGLDEGVNVTLGLPFVRTSPDHGTAFDLAGTGRADPGSFQAAWRMARTLLAGRAQA
ncbi:MAG: 4-hydroxythreonine-4-phosphate dehydrogenase PdxA [Pseudomonadota bacterium]